MTTGFVAETGLAIGSLLLVLVNLIYYFRGRNALYGGFSLAWGLLFLYGLLYSTLPESFLADWANLVDSISSLAAFVFLAVAFLQKKGTIPVHLGYIFVALIVLQVLIIIGTSKSVPLDLLFSFIASGALFSSAVLLTTGEGGKVKFNILFVRTVIFFWAILLFLFHLSHQIPTSPVFSDAVHGLTILFQITSGFLLLMVVQGNATWDELKAIPQKVLDQVSMPILAAAEEVDTGRVLIKQANQFAANLYGYELEEFEGMPFERLWGTDSEAIDVRHIQGNFETTHLRKDGTPVDLRIHTSRVRLGDVDQFGFLLTDVTEAKAFKQTLIQQEEQYRRVFSSIDDALIVSQGMRLLLVNPAMERLVGAPEHTLQTFEDLLKFVDPPTRAAMLDRLHRWARGEEVTEFFDFRAESSDGRVAELELQSFRVPWFGDEPALITIVRDVARYKNVEREREKMYETRLEAEKLQSEWLALTLETSRLTSIGVIAAEITHEINQPMNAITLAADGIDHWAKQNPHLFPEFAQNLLKNIGSGSKRVSEILAHLNRLYTPLDQYTLEPLDLRSIVKNCIRLIEGQARSNDAKIEFKVPEASCIVTADSVQLEQLFANLMLISLNKLVQSNVKEPKLIVSISPDNDGVKTSIADNGSMLYTMGNTLSVESYMHSDDSDPGDSVRLTVVRHLVERFNGTLHNRQNDLGGTTMSVLFPRTRPDTTGGNP